MVDPQSALLMTISLFFFNDLIAALSALVILSPLICLLFVPREIISWSSLFRNRLRNVFLLSALVRELFFTLNV